MRVLIAHNAYQLPGGEDTCVAAEAAMLRSYGHEVTTYMVSNDDIDQMSRLDLARRTIWSRPAFHELRELCYRAQPQVAHFHNTFPLISPAAYYAARGAGVPVVQTLHNHRLLCCNAVLFRNGRACQECLGSAVPWRGVLKGCYRDSRLASAGVAGLIAFHKAIGTWRNAVDLYIALSSASRAILIEGGLDAGRIVVKPNFVFPDPGVGRGGGEYCLYVGRLSAEKGLMTLIRAWQHFGSPLPLRIVGDGPMRTQVEEAIARCRDIELLGRLAPDDVHHLVGEAELVIVPSECHETFGRVVAEAYAKGTPVLAANIGGLADIVMPGETGQIFAPGNPADLAEKVHHLLADRDRLRRMRGAARSAYERSFSAEISHANLIAIYEHVLLRRSQLESGIGRVTH